jgi:hypothetical protein
MNPAYYKICDMGNIWSSPYSNNASSKTQTFFLVAENYFQHHQFGSTYSLHMNPILMKYLENKRTNKCVLLHSMTSKLHKGMICLQWFAETQTPK